MTEIQQGMQKYFSRGRVDGVIENARQTLFSKVPLDMKLTSLTLCAM